MKNWAIDFLFKYWKTKKLKQDLTVVRNQSLTLNIPIFKMILSNYILWLPKWVKSIRAATLTTNEVAFSKWYNLKLFNSTNFNLKVATKHLLRTDIIVQQVGGVQFPTAYMVPQVAPLRSDPWALPGITQDQTNKQNIIIQCVCYPSHTPKCNKS